jgi:hypothetical protein
MPLITLKASCSTLNSREKNEALAAFSIANPNFFHKAFSTNISGKYEFYFSAFRQLTSQSALNAPRYW